MNNDELVTPVTMDRLTRLPTPRKERNSNNRQGRNPGHSPESETAAGSDVGPAATIAISHAGQFYSELQWLLSQNPDRYKQVLTGIAERISAAAHDAGDAEQHLLSLLAQRLQQASGGDLAALHSLQAPMSADRSAYLAPPPFSPHSPKMPQDAPNLDVSAQSAKETPLKAQVGLPVLDSLAVNALHAPHPAVNPHSVAAVYGTHNPLLSEAFQAKDTITYQPSFSPPTQRMLDSIFDELHGILFGGPAPEDEPHKESPSGSWRF